MYKWVVKIIYPDIETAGCPNIETTFVLYADTPQKAEKRAFYNGVAIVRDMLHYNRINPYIIEQVATEMVSVVWVREWQSKY